LYRSNELREDNEKLAAQDAGVNKPDAWRDGVVLKNAQYKYEEFFIAPSSNNKE
jgi:hypothetical protein